MKDLTILVTGGAGFIGSNLANKLAVQNEVIAIDKIFPQGTHIISWSGKPQSSGVYFIKLNDGMDIKIRKMILVK